MKKSLSVGFLTVKIRYFLDKAHYNLWSQANNPRWYHSNQQEKSAISAGFQWYGIRIRNKFAESISVTLPFQVF